MKHPATYAAKIDAGELPIADREVLSAATRYTEDVMLRLRLAAGVPLATLAPEAARVIPQLIGDGLAREREGHLVLTDRGRLLADAVVRTVLDA